MRARHVLFRGRERHRKGAVPPGAESKTSRPPLASHTFDASTIYEVVLLDRQRLV